MSFFTLDEIKLMASKTDCCAYLKNKQQFLDADLMIGQDTPNKQKPTEPDIITEIGTLEIKMNKIEKEISKELQDG